MINRPSFYLLISLICMNFCTIARGQKNAASSTVTSAPSHKVIEYKWVNVTNNAAYAPRDGAGALVYKEKMWLLGGWNPTDKVFFPRICNNEVWNSTDGVTWNPVRPNTFGTERFDPEKEWEGRHTAGYVVFKNRMWIVGGDVNQGHYHFDVWNSEDGKTWTHVNKNKNVPWGPRALHYTLVFKDKIWVMGGQTIPQFAKEKERFYNDIWNSSDGVNWVRVIPVEPVWTNRGMIGGYVVFKDRIWILGGGTYDTPEFPDRKFYNDVWSSPDGIHWTRHVESAPWTPRQYHDVAVFDNKMWVMEGWNKENRNDVWYSSDGVKWNELPDTPWKPRHAASVFVYNDALWMVAGNNMEKDVWKLPGSLFPQEQNVFLKSFSVSPGTPPIVFRTEWRQYTVNVANIVDSVVVTPTAETPDAIVLVNGKPVQSGQSSDPVPVEVGRNMITIEVTTREGTSRERYTLKVMRMYPTPAWVKVQESAPWLPRDSAGELVFKDKMWLFGGYTPDVINDIWCSGDGVNWTAMGTIPDPKGVNIPVNLVYDDKMWIVCNDGKLYSSEDGSHWMLVTENAPWAGRYAAGGVVFDNKMWVMGGKKGSDLYNDIWSSKDGLTWTLETEKAHWSRRQLFSMIAVLDNKVWVLGGGITVYHPFKAYTDVWNSPDGKNWTRITDAAPWPSRIWSTSAVYKNRLWVLGGFRAEPTWINFNDAWYSADGIGWKEFVIEPAWSPRHELSAFVFHDRLWVVGGNAWPLMNDVWYLEIKGLTFVTQPVCEEFVNAQYTYKALADFNTSGKKIHYRLIESPAWLGIDPETGTLRGIPGEAGDTRVGIEAYDDDGESARQTYTLHIVPLL